MLLAISTCLLGKTSVQKNVYFRALPKSPSPPPIPPIRATWPFFFGQQKQHFARMTEQITDDDNDCCNDNCDGNDGNFDDNDVKND